MNVLIAWDLEVPEGIAEEALVRAAQQALAHGGQPHKRVQLILVSDETLAELHGRFLDDPSPTDVMAFDLGEEQEGPEGEVYVSVPCAQRVAGLRRVSVERELALYVVHGCLHLCGLDDRNGEDRRAMRAAERVVLAELGYPVDGAPHELGFD